MTKKRCIVTFPGDNTLTALELSQELDKMPIEAKVRTRAVPGSDPEIIIWWDEEVW